MPQSRFTWTLLLIGSFLLGVAWIMESREEPTTAEAASSVMEAPAAGHLAPDFTLETLNGDSFTLSDYRGQPVVLNFWATWCPPCRAEIPFFQAASRTYNGQVAVVGIDDGEPRGIVAPYVAEMGMTYPVPLDETSEVSRRYRISSLPTTFFIDSAGTIQNIHIGILNQAVLDDQISQLLDS
ncbi:MAG: TlpA family protein disulfide reductase [Chloroflexota bacterium]